MKKNIYTIIGTDTYFGAHMLKHLQAMKQIVIGCTQGEPFRYEAESICVSDLGKYEDMPAVDGEWIVICLDPGMGFEAYAAKLKGILDHLRAREFIGDICFFSSAAICMPDADQPISETSAIYPRNGHDLALVTGENLLSVFGCSNKGYAVPHIMRIGVPYGNEADMKAVDGFVNKMISEAENNVSLKIPMGGEAKRSLIHISDICRAVTQLMNSENCPMLVNIPGEIKTISEVGHAISRKYHVDFIERGLNLYDELDFFAGDQYLSDELFNESLKYERQYLFDSWLSEKPMLYAAN